MSIAAELSRIQTNRNTIRAKLVELGMSTSTANLDALASAIDSLINQGAVSVSVKEGETYTIPAGYHNGSGTVSGVAGGAAAAEAFFRLLQAVPEMRGWLEVHPHEPAFGAWDPKWLNGLKMLSPAVEIVYSRQLGNRITPKLLNPWMAEFRRFGHDVPVLFRPGLSDAASLAQEADELAEMINEWQKEGKQ